MIELTDVDATNLVRLLYASARKAVGERIVPATDNRKQYYTKAQKVSSELGHFCLVFRQLSVLFHMFLIKIPASRLLQDLLYHMRS